MTAGYLDVIGNPIVRGRDISEQDTRGLATCGGDQRSVRAEVLPRRGSDRKALRPEVRGKPREFEIVGVAKDARYLTYNLDRPIGPLFFLPERSTTFPTDTQVNMGSHFLRDIVILTQPGCQPADRGAAPGHRFRGSEYARISTRTMREQVASQFTQQRLIARLTSFFGILSLVLASIGLYGVTAYNAGRRSTRSACAWRWVQIADTWCDWCCEARSG